MEQRLPKPKVGGSTPLGTAMISNKNFRFVARAHLALFAKSASGATRGYMLGYTFNWITKELAITGIGMRDRDGNTVTRIF
jgi:hypothetical protein